MWREAIRHAMSYALDAERKMGTMLIAGEESGEVAIAGQPKRNVPTGYVKPATAKSLGISRKEKAEAQMLAELSEEIQDAVTDGKKTDDGSVTFLLEAFTVKGFSGQESSEGIG